MCYLNGWHPFESIGFDLVKITMWAMPSSSDLGATKTASTKTKSNSIKCTRKFHALQYLNYTG